MHDNNMPRPIDDHEGQMAKSELYRAAKYSMKLFQMIDENQELEGWVQAKISKSADYLDSVYHYMEYQVKFGGGTTASSIDDITDEADQDVVKVDRISDMDDEEEFKNKKVDESMMSYEQKLQALLEGAMKKVKGKKAEEKKDELDEGSKPDFLDMDKDGDKKEPMKKAVKDKKSKEVKEAVATVVEKAVSKAQQKFMGMVHAAKKGEKPASKEVAKAAKGMSDKEAKKFASTKHKGLPEKKEKKTDESQVMSPPDGATAAPKKDPKTGRYPKVTSGPNKGKEWSEKTPGPTNPAMKENDLVKSIVKKVVAEKKAGKGKPDFLDMDKDGDKKEPMKKAVADKKKETVKESADLERMKQMLKRLNG